MRWTLTLLAALSVVVAGGRAQTQAGVPIRIAAVNRSADLAAWDRQVSVLEQGGMLERISSDVDQAMPSRIHERLVQQFQGVRIFGGDVTRQLDQFGQAASIFGTIYPDVAVDTTPTVSLDDARDLVSQAGYGVVDASMPMTKAMSAAPARRLSDPRRSRPGPARRPSR